MLVKALLLVLGGIVAFNVVTIAGLAVSEIRDRRRRGLEVRYLQTLWHVDRPPLFRSGTSVPPWHDARSDHGGKPLGIALIAVTIFARTALAAGTGARRVATAVLSSMAQELGLQPAEAEVSVAAAPSVDVAFDPGEADESHHADASASGRPSGGPRATVAQCRRRRRHRLWDRNTRRGRAPTDPHGSTTCTALQSPGSAFVRRRAGSTSTGPRWPVRMSTIARTGRVGGARRDRPDDRAHSDTGLGGRNYDYRVVKSTATPSPLRLLPPRRRPSSILRCRRPGRRGPVAERSGGWADGLETGYRIERSVDGDRGSRRHPRCTMTRSPAGSRAGRPALPGHGDERGR